MKIYKKIREHISKNELEEALHLIEKVCIGNKNFEKDFAKLLARLNAITADFSSGTITQEELRIEKNRLVATILDLVEAIERKSDFSFLGLEQKNENSFLQQINLEGLSTVYLIGHTGRNLLHDFHRLFEDKDYFYKPEIKILLRNPNSETQRRFAQIFSSFDNVIRKFRDEGYKVDIDFYESPPYIRAIIGEYQNGERLSFISFYQYRPRKKSKAWDMGFVIEDSLSERNDLVEYAVEWFGSFFGRHEIHSIVFDFDDTLADTMDIQVDAWCLTIKELIEQHGCKPEYLSSEIEQVLDDQKAFFKIIKRIFLEEQMADEIREAIFSNLPDADSERIIGKVKSIRFKTREQLTREKAKLFEGAKQLLSQLKDDYQLSIISSTSESLIRHILRKSGIFSYFSDIFGKYGPKESWGNVESKSEKLIKLSKKTGVPLERMIYIGDNHGDYKATRQLNIKFIEARIQASRNKIIRDLNIETLIDYPPNEKIRYFENYEDDQLLNLIDSFNQEWKAAKENLTVDFLKK